MVPPRPTFSTVYVYIYIHRHTHTDTPKQTLKSWWHDTPLGGTPGPGGYIILYYLYLYLSLSLSLYIYIYPIHSWIILQDGADLHMATAAAAQLLQLLGKDLQWSTGQLINSLTFAVAAESCLLMNFHSSWLWELACQIYKNPWTFADVASKYKGYDVDLAIGHLADFFDATTSRRKSTFLSWLGLGYLSPRKTELFHVD